jgi:hypothetical protein
MTIWEHFESLVLQFLEDRTSELLTQGDVAPSPRLIATVRSDAAWAAEKAIARFMAREGVQKGMEGSGASTLAVSVSRQCNAR